MKKILFAILILGVCSCKETTPTFVTNHDWSQPEDPAGNNAEAWKSVKRAEASFGSADVRYPRAELYTGEIAKKLSVTGWKGEKISAQAIVWTPVEIANLRCEISPMKGDDGTVIDGAVRARFVNYVLSDWFTPERPCGARKPNEPSRLMPDLLDEAPTTLVPANNVKPVWITVDVPRDAAAGAYTSTITLKGKGFNNKLKLDLDVIDRTLPEPSQWSYHLDLWQHPAAVARVESVPVWSDEHFERMKPLMKMLADAGQKVITATLNKEPWNNQCYDAYADMIIWTRNADGTWEYDFTVFDRWVQFMLDLGITKMVNCYSMLPWNNMLHYKDGATGQFTDVKADPGTPEFRMMWEPFLPAFQNHLREKGWLAITNIAMDERSPEHMAEATALLAEVAPELGIALADNHKIFKKYPYIKDMCASIFGPIDRADILDRRAQGLNTTFYVCCSSEFPNTYTFSDPAEATYYAWHAAAHDYDGFLRWTYNSWPEDPIRDSRFRTWAAGDTFIVYPEARSSIRFERMIEGIQDFEKMRILRQEEGMDEKLDALVAQFRADTREEGWNERLNEARLTLNEM